MKVFIFTLSTLILLALACKTQKMVLYEFPVEMKDPVKAEYTKICDKGKILYDIHCANCHNTKRKGRESIPDFTAEQLETYVIRNSPKMDITEEKVSAEELGNILTFLTYKTKNPAVKSKEVK